MIAKYFSQDFPSLLVNYTVCIKELGKNEENLVSQNLCVCVSVSMSMLWKIVGQYLKDSQRLGNNYSLFILCVVLCVIN